MIMAVAATGGGLLSAAAVAAPAYAAAPATAPPASQTFTITGHLTKQATSGIGPHAVLPCATKAGASDCRPQTIICWITANTPILVSPVIFISATASVHCDNPVDNISLDETMYRNGVSVDQRSTNDGPDVADSSTFVLATSCGPVEYDNFAFATVRFPPDYFPGTGSLHQTTGFTPTASDCTPPPPPGGGGGGGTGGGGCATTSASSSAHPAARHPDVVTCQ